MSFKDLLAIIEEKQAGFVLLMCHRSADADAICSAYGLQGLIKRFLPNTVVEIGCPAGINKPSKTLLDYLPITVSLKPNIESAEVIVLLDMNTIEQLDEATEAVKKSPAPKIIIDHHAPNQETLKQCSLCIIDDKASANCELIYRLYAEAQVKPNLNEAKALFVGIAFDTRHFALANSPTFGILAALVEEGIDAQQTLAQFALPIETSERIAKLKACKRAKIVQVDNWIIALSHVSAFQAPAAKALIDLGAHVSAVAGKKSGKIEISLRSVRQFNEGAGVHLGTDIAAPLGEYLQGIGGGHAMASGVSGKGEIQDALKQCLTLLKQKITKPEQPPTDKTVEDT
ncbi:DHH family phosphoesterase [Candidatus Bathycorpusculum sp.]|uniref:DHH family phosphoesterase n=1 Tax=Candidatus Bathycorpusculum sp. TaxID=2994959 RepID=UPI002832D760|nr:DHH family phosphoesterase [Candidatus Termitimicrobium sp.]MCL2684911.1 DHH family phosphoesterase [Candidatus Termitimicrobium sp.]